MNLSDQEIIAQLGKPGEGLPLAARILNRIYLKPFVMRFSNWKHSLKGIEAAQAKIKKELEGVAAEKLTQRVLIPPQIGLEDSSRYWSVAMTLRHLTIVGEHMERVIIGLSHRIDGGKVISTAEVKPEAEMNTPQAVSEYLKFSEKLLNEIERKVRDRNSDYTYRHPWFGKLTSKEWLWVMKAHHFIHLRQIRNIKQGLK